MGSDDVMELVEAAAAEPDERDAVQVALRAARRVQSWAEGRATELSLRLASFVSFPEKEIASATQSSQGEAAAVLRRGATALEVPAFGAALAAGDITGAHVDAVGRVARSLEGPQREEFADVAATYAASAKYGSARDLEKALRAEANAIRADHGERRHERLKAAARVRTGVDDEGMWWLHAKLDPVAGLAVERRLHTKLRALFAESVPAGCPSDPVDKNQWLQAQAFTELMTGSDAPSLPGDVVVVIDTTVPQPDGSPTIDCGLPVEVPWSVVEQFFTEGEVWPIVVRSGAVAYAPGTLDLGRTTRLANRAQRRALAALYPSCAVPGCEVRFVDCKIHHVIWWEHHGRTDLVNLLPLCHGHHDAVHHHGWVLTLSADRLLRIDYPDGTTTLTPPPRRGPQVRRASPVPRT
jgi:hypothetical protein